MTRAQFPNASLVMAFSLILLISAIVNTSSLQVPREETNLITNPTFDTDLSGWTTKIFENEGPNPTATVEWKDGRVYIETHDNAFGMLKQDYGHDVLASHIEVDYERYLGTTCNQLEVSFYAKASDTNTRFLRVVVRGDNFYIYDPHYIMVSFLSDEWTVITKSNPDIEKGLLQLDFNYNASSLDISVSNVKYHTFQFPSKSDVVMQGITLWGVNQCYDSRDYSYTYFDNVVVNEWIDPAGSTTPSDTGSPEANASSSPTVVQLTWPAAPVVAASFLMLPVVRRRFTRRLI